MQMNEILYFQGEHEGIEGITLTNHPLEYFCQINIIIILLLLNMKSRPPRAHSLALAEQTSQPTWNNLAPTWHSTSNVLK